MCIGGDKNILLKTWGAWNRLRSQFEALGRILGASWMHFGTSWPSDETAKVNLGGSWMLFGASKLDCGTPKIEFYQFWVAQGHARAIWG